MRIPQNILAKRSAVMAARLRRVSARALSQRSVKSSLHRPLRGWPGRLKQAAGHDD